LGRSKIIERVFGSVCRQLVRLGDRGVRGGDPWRRIACLRLLCPACTIGSSWIHIMRSIWDRFFMTNSFCILSFTFEVGGLWARCCKYIYMDSLFYKALRCRCQADLYGIIRKRQSYTKSHHKDHYLLLMYSLHISRTGTQFGSRSDN